MKIAFLTDGIYPFVVGGMQKHSFSLSRELVIAGHDLDLFHCVNPEDEIPSRNMINNFFFEKGYEFNNIHCIKFPSSYYFPGHYIYNSYKYSSWIYSILKNNFDEYDVIYSQGFTSWKLIKTQKRKISNLYVNFHGFEMFQHAPNKRVKFEHILLRPIVKFICRNSNYVFSFGKKISKIINSIGIADNKIITSYNGISSRWLNISSNSKHGNPLIFLFIGRNERRKGYQELCSAIINIKDFRIQFHFIGDIPQNERLRISYHDLFYHGLIKDDSEKIKIFDLCDVLICPSFSEGMPTVILEAMSRGMVILANNVGAVESMVSKSNGILMHSNSKNEIIESIKDIMSKESSEIEALKNHSLELVKQNFFWGKIVDDLDIKLKHNIGN